MPRPIVIPGFRGMRPRRRGHDLDPGQARLARNCDLSRASLRPMAGLETIDVLEQPGELGSIALFEGKWLAWPGDVDVVASPYPSARRIMFTGDGYPRQTDADMAFSGVPESFPTQTLRLGIEEPPTPLSVQLLGAAGEEVVRSTSYVYTYVNEWGQESAPSPPSAVLDVSDGQSVRLTGFAVPTLPAVSAASYRVYRLVTGAGGAADYQLVGEPDAGITQYDDAKTDDQLGEVLVTEDWTRPPDALQGLLLAQNGICFGFAGRELFVSETGIPYAFPEAWILEADEDIVGIGYYGTTVVACTTGRPWIATGIEPAAMAFVPLSFEQACASKRSVVSVPGGVLYAGTDGLAFIGPEGGRILTQETYTSEQWQVLGPQDIIACVFEGAYMAFFAGTGTGIAVELATGDVRELRLPRTVHGLHHEPAEALYLLTFDGTDWRVERWKGGTAALEYRWHSHTDRQERAWNPTAAQVVGAQDSTTPVTFRLYGDGALRHEAAVPSSEPFRLPAGYAAREVEVELEGLAEVDAVRVAASVEELLHG